MDLASPQVSPLSIHEIHPILPPKSSFSAPNSPRFLICEFSRHEWYYRPQAVLPLSTSSCTTALSERYYRPGQFQHYEFHHFHPPRPFASTVVVLVFENLSCGSRVLLCFGYIGTVRRHHHHRSTPSTTQHCQGR